MSICCKQYVAASRNFFNIISVGCIAFGALASTVNIYVKLIEHSKDILKFYTKRS